MLPTSTRHHIGHLLRALLHGRRGPGRHRLTSHQVHRLVPYEVFSSGSASAAAMLAAEEDASPNLTPKRCRETRVVG
jgi:hypothetical protein